MRIKSCITGVIILAFAVFLVLVHEDSYLLIPILLGLSILLYGIKLLWYYLRMARYMVGGKSFLYQAIFVMDFGVFTLSIIGLNNRIIVLIYLLGIYAFTGVVDVLRALEAKGVGATGWKLKLFRGISGLLFVVALFIIGFVVGRTDIFIYGFCFSLAYSAIIRIITAFRRSAVVVLV